MEDRTARPSDAGSITQDPEESRSGPRPLRPGEAGGAALPVVDPSSYRVEGEYARGGLGRVLLAHDVRLGRTVALKEILAPGAAAVARFVREAKVTARLQHPGIVPVYESGCWPTGEPFYAMRLVQGDPLTAAIARTTNLAERLTLVPNLVAVADAVAYAHGQRVIHRDLKPDNVLVGAFGETVVIDWGLAKAVDEDDPEALAFDAGTGDLPRNVTVAGAVVGTPAYMAPEQARGEALDERADVYALGAVIYQALSGVAPHAGGPTREALARRATEVPTPLEARVRDVPRDLATIVRKAMALRPEDRYPSARELAEDLRRFQTGQLVSARRYSRWTLLGRWLRRHRAAAGAVAAAAVTLGVVGGVSVERVVRERNRAERALVEARRQAEALVLLHAQNALERDATAALAWIRAYPDAGADRLAAWNVVVEAEARGVARHVLSADDAEPFAKAFSADGRWLVTTSMRRAVAWELVNGALREVFELPRLIDLAPLPGGRAMLASNGRAALYELPLPSGAARERLPLPGRWRVLRLSPDGVVAFGGPGPPSLITLSTGATRSLPAPEGSVSDLCYAADGASLVGGGSDRVVRAWSLATGEARTLGRHDAPVDHVACGRGLVASAAHDGTVYLTRDGAAPQALGGQSGPVEELAFSPDAALLASAGAPAGLVVWDTTTGARRGFEGHQGQAQGLSFSPDGGYLAVASADDTVRLWESSGGAPVAALTHPMGELTPRFSPDGRWLASSGSDGATRVWSVPNATRTLRGHTDRAIHAVFSPDGRWLVTDGDDHTVRLWEVSSGRGRVLGTHSDRAYGVEFSRDGRYVVSAGEDGRVGLFDLREGTARMLEGHRGRVREIASSPRGDLFASAGEDGTVRLWDLATGTARVLTGHRDGVSRVGFSPDGALLATFGGERDLRLWNVATGESRVLADGLGVAADGSFRPAFSPDGRRVASCATGGTLAMWSLEGAALGRWRLPPGDAPCTRLAFSPDGRLLALPVGSALELLDLRSGAWRSLRGHSAAIHHFHFSASGRFVATASVDNTARVWELATGAAQVVHRHGSAVFDASLSPDESHVATASADGTAWVGPFDPARGLRPDVASVRARIASLTTAVIVHGRPRTPLVRR